MTNPRLLRIVTVPMSLSLLLRGQFRFFREQGFEVVTASAAGAGIQQVIDEGAAHVVIPFTRKITPLRDLWCLWLTIRLIRRIKPHIVHTHTPKAGLIGMMAARLCAVPIRMHTVAGLPMMEAKGFRRWILGLTERVTLICATRVYPNGAGLDRFLRARFPKASARLRMLGSGSSNGIDCDFFQRSPHTRASSEDLRNNLELAPGETVYCFVGRLVRDKGIVELIDAFTTLDFPARLLLVGPPEADLDPLPPRTLETIANHPRIVSAGFQADVRSWICAADVFVFPSYREGFPNVVLQACALEVPCIVSDIPGCNEIIEDRVTGLIVPAKDSVALEHAMRTLARDPGSGKEFARKARAFVRTHFDQKAFWQKLFAEYKEQLSRHVPGFH